MLVMLLICFRFYLNHCHTLIYLKHARLTFGSSLCELRLSQRKFTDRIWAQHLFAKHSNNNPTYTCRSLFTDVKWFRQKIFETEIFCLFTEVVVKHENVTTSILSNISFFHSFIHETKHILWEIFPFFLRSNPNNQLIKRYWLTVTYGVTKYLIK